MSHTIIIGAGGHARSVAARWQEFAALFHPHVVDVLFHHSDDDIPPGAMLINGVGNKPTSTDSGLKLRAGIFNRFGRDRFWNVGMEPLYESRGVQRMHNVVINPGARIGDNVILNTGCIVEHDAVIGNHCHIAPGAIVLGGVQIGSLVHVGAGAVVLPGLTIGDGAVIGAGAVVIRDVPAGATVVGNPGRVVG